MSPFPFLGRAAKICREDLSADELNGFVLHSYVEDSTDGHQMHYDVMKNINSDTVIVSIESVISGPASRLYETQGDLDAGSDEKRWVIKGKPVQPKSTPIATRKFIRPAPNSGIVDVELSVHLASSYVKPYFDSKPLSW